MQKYLYIFAALALFVALGAGCSEKPIGSYELNEAEGDGANQLEATESIDTTMDIEEEEPESAAQEAEYIPASQSYTNPRFGYSLSYPGDWFFANDACCPPPPAFVVLNNVSDVFFEFTPRQFDAGVCSFSVLCGYEGVLDDIGEVQLYQAEGEPYSEVSINGYPAYQFANSIYVVDGTNGCRINYTGGCAENYGILNSFSF